MLSRYASSSILKAICGKSQYAFSSNSGVAYMALSSSDPSKRNADGQISENVTEPQGKGYKRTLIGHYFQPLTQKMGEPSEYKITNEEEIHFDEAEEAWGELSHICIFNAPTGGNLLAWGELGKMKANPQTGEQEWVAEPIDVAKGYVVVLKENDVQISIN